MTGPHDQSFDSGEPSGGQARELRRRADEKAAAMGAGQLERLSPGQIERLVHELRVHQIELELQNEELRRAQQELEASRTRYFSLYDLAPAGYVTIDEKGLITEVNLAAATLLAAPRSALCGQPLSRFILPADQDIYYRLRQALVKTQKTQVRELRLARPQAEPVWVRLQTALDRDKETGAGLYRAVMVDITERKLAEETLRLNEARFRTLMEASSEVLYRMSPDWREMRQLQGGGFLADTERPNCNWLQEYIHPDDQPQVTAAIDEAIRTRSAFVFELRVRQADGTLGWTFSRAVPLLDAKGDVEEWFGAASDVTARKQAEEALQIGRERQELLTAVAQRLLRAEDPQVVVEDVCRKVMTHIDCQFFFNYLVEEPGRRMHLNACAGVPKSVADSIRQLDFGAAVCGCVARDEKRIIAEDIHDTDDPRTELVKSFGVQAYCCHPLLVEGRVIGTLSFGTRTRPVFSTDEVELMRSVADQVAVAMHRLQVNQSLRDSEDRLKVSLSEKEVLLKEIHHRVKNNMQVISSLVNLQADEVKDPGLRDIFKDVIYRVRSMAMVHEKLYQSTDLARVDFADYAQSHLRYLWQAQGSAASGIQLRLDLKPVLLSVDAAVPCGLILNELFTNALKHAFKGRDSGKVSVSLHRNDHGEVRLRVQDNGTGMPQDFDWQKPRSLGLRLVQMLARQIHAAVEVASDQGTTFTISFEVQSS